MATYLKGILGVFTGKVGTVVGSSWKGIDYMRSLPKKTTKAPTQAQLDQRFKFGLVNNFFKSISSLVDVGFSSVAGKQTALNAAVAYHLKEAVVGTSPDFQIDFSKVLISRGELLSPWLPTATVSTAAAIDFSWTDNSGANLSAANDLLVLLVYNPSTKEYVFLENAALRSDTQATLALPANFSGAEVHSWMAFFAADRKTVSTSFYLGKITII